MSPEQFVKQYWPYAKAAEVKDGVPALFSIAQSAQETGWGQTIVGNMMFGVKDTDGINGNEQLLVTTEYNSRPDVKYPFILSVTEVIKGKRWKYKIKDWFRKYPSPEESFRDHAVFLKKNPRYSKAFYYLHSPYQFAKEVCAAGYATDPNYYASIESIMHRVQGIVNIYKINA
ncbi:MAG: glycoside hydrolase family 73 protein [Flavipsychrobacter sp.]